MADWVMTATTIYCDAVEEEVTLMIDKDGTSRCTGCNKFKEPTGEIARQISARCKQYGKELECEGLECYRVVEYRERLLAEDGGSL
jgi:hypothetical protein